MNIKATIFLGVLCLVVACSNSTQTSTTEGKPQESSSNEWNKVGITIAYSITSSNCYKPDDTTSVYAKLLSMVVEDGTMLIIPDYNCEDITNICLVTDDNIRPLTKNTDRRHKENTFFAKYEDFSNQKNAGFMFRDIFKGKCTTIIFNDNLTSEIEKSRNISVGISFKQEIFTFQFIVDKDLQSTKED